MSFQVGMMARFHNIMGRDTIRCLELITQEIKEIFSHDVLSDRIAAMLNHFLLNLVSTPEDVVLSNHISLIHDKLE